MPLMRRGCAAFHRKARIKKVLKGIYGGTDGYEEVRERLGEVSYLG